MSVVEIRQFSRTFTQRIGALDDHFLGRDRPLGAARLLFEVGVHGASVGELRERLGLDSGYASRLLRHLEADGLVYTTPDAADRRRRLVGLTSAGAAEWELLDALSNRQIESIVSPLGAGRTAELASILTRARRLLGAAAVTFDAIDARHSDARSTMSAYFAELDERFPTGFDPGDALDADPALFDAPGGAFVVVRDPDQRSAIGCGGLQTLEPGVGEIKRMWIGADWRGLGLAGRLLADLEHRGREIGHDTIRLDTNAVLTDAIAMYERAGYQAIERYNDNPYAQRWFEKPLRTAVLG
jgi:DNA-binding MarR family transcriptional regulator/GNAT superfamily N-acetyltransferase